MNSKSSSKKKDGKNARRGDSSIRGGRKKKGPREDDESSIDDRWKKPFPWLRLANETSGSTKQSKGGGQPAAKN